MAISLLRDDNGEVVQNGKRVIFSSSGIKVATAAAAIAELDISTLNVVANRNIQGEVLFRISATTQNLFFSLGVAATAPSDNTTMLYLAAGNSIEIRAQSAAVSCYHQRSTADGVIQVAVLV